MLQRDALTMGYASNGYRAGDNTFVYSSKTQVMAAALAANSVVFGMQVGTFPDSSSYEYIARIRLQWTTITAFATPVTAGRGLRWSEGNNVSPTGGTLLLPLNKTNFGASSLFGPLGITRIATTVALGGIAPAGPSGGEFVLSGYGNAGASVSYEWDFSKVSPLGFTQLSSVSTRSGLTSLVIFNPQAMDAGGTWELAVEVETVKLPNNFPIPTP